MLPLRFADEARPRPQPSGIDVVSTLLHFAIITYAVPPERLRPLVHERFELLTVPVGGEPRALVSVVPFQELDFRLAAYPSPQFRFGQTNYRVYVLDRTTGKPCVWFLGSLLDSLTVVIPRYLWKLPWHHGRMQFDCRLGADGRYSHYAIETRSAWGGAQLQLRQAEGLTQLHHGFPDEETARVYLTHPLSGYYTRRDGRLGSYSIWHDKLEMQAAEVVEARFEALERLGVASFEEQRAPYSVLVQAETEFTIYLPPGLA
ncbi:MAG: DUF2071 domain-containing protein [Anaerolineales bacterium]|nr:DUF2071 domain-containing protein [Anaerolineales bacterium]